MCSGIEQDFHHLRMALQRSYLKTGTVVSSIRVDFTAELDQEFHIVKLTCEGSRMQS